MPSICNSFQCTSAHPVHRIMEHYSSEDNPGFSIIKESSEVSKAKVIFLNVASRMSSTNVPKTEYSGKIMENLLLKFLCLIFNIKNVKKNSIGNFMINVLFLHFYQEVINFPTGR